MTAGPKTLFDKIWDQHVVVPETLEHPATLYIDFHLINEVTSPQAFSMLKARGLKVHRPAKAIATIDHSTPTLINKDGSRPYITPQSEVQVETLIANAKANNIEVHDWNSNNRGIVHVIGPELGATQPGMTIVCGDSHTATHGAFGAIAFGIGTTQISHVLAYQSLLLRKPKAMAITVEGELEVGVSAKDVILAIIAKIGVGGGTGYAIEYRGSTIDAMSMAERMTVCNMSIEAGARYGLIAPDDTTFEYLRGRKYAPADFEKACESWRSLATDDGAEYDKEIYLKAEDIRPMVSYGTHPGMSVAIDARVPSPKDEAEEDALTYMQIEDGEAMTGLKVDRVFIGSCTNSRLEDLRSAAAIMRGGQVPSGLIAIVVPGSSQVKREAEKEGLDKIFISAGAEWREPGCSMCIAMNGDIAAPGELVVSTSNRNFLGRQGPGARTVLASPATAAATAIRGVLTDPRNVLVDSLEIGPSI